MTTWLWIAAGGALGSAARYAASVAFGQRAATTFLVNVAGSFAIGVLMGALPALHPRWRFVLGIGFLGGFTTFSTFEWETLEAVRRGHYAAALLNALGSVAAGFIAVWLGFAAGSKLR